MTVIGTYTLTHVKSGRFYVGSSGDVKKRLDRHWSELRSGKHHCRPLQEIWNNGGDLAVAVIETDTREEAYELEQDFLDRFAESSQMLNIQLGATGGDVLKRNPKREEIISNIRQAIAKRMAALTPLEKKLLFGLPGKRNGMWGRTHTPEVKAMIGDLHRGNQYNLGRKFPEDHRKQISEHAKKRVGELNPFYGKQHSEDTKKRISEIRKAQELLPPNTRKVEVNGVIYESLTEASRQLEVSPALIVYRLKKDKEGYRYVP